MRYRFECDRKLLSASQIANGIEAGHEFLDLLHACAHKSKPALNKLAQLLEATSQRAESTAAWRAKLKELWKPPAPSKLPRLNHLRKVSTKANSVRAPWNPPILERPLALSQIKAEKRKVPYLVVTQGVPFLRYPGPQPQSLSRVIRQQHRWWEKKWEQKLDLEADITLAQWEDRWDQIVGRQIRHSSMDPDTAETLRANEEREFDGSWASALREVHTGISQQIRERDIQRAEMGRQMWQVIVRERELAKQEKREAKQKRRQTRQAGLGTAPTAQ